MPNDITELDLQPYEEQALDLQPFEAKPDFRRDELAKQTFQARLEGEQAKALRGLTEVAYNTAEALSPAGLMNQPFRAVGAQDPYQAGRPLVTLPKPEGIGFLSGLGQLAAGTLEGFTTPEMLVTLPAAGASPVVRALFAGEMAKSIPEGIGIAGETLRDPQATTAQKVVATGQPLISAAFVRGLAKTPEILMPVEFNRANIPISGTAVQSPRGAIPPRAEPAAPIERVTPEQAALATERMSAPFEGNPLLVRTDLDTVNAIKTLKEKYPTDVIESAFIKYENETHGIDPTTERGRKIAAPSFALFAKEAVKGNEKIVKLLEETKQSVQQRILQEPSRIETTAPIETQAVEPPKPTGVKAVEQAEVPKVKEPWEMTRDEIVSEIKNRLAEAEKINNTALKAAKLVGLQQQLESAQQWKPVSVKRTASEIVKGGNTKDVTRSIVVADIPLQRRKSVEKAIKEGKPVPAEVLADYPDLKPTRKPTETPVEAPAQQPAKPITQGPGTEIVPMGGDVLGANAPKTPMQSAIKNSAVDRDRVDRGELPMMDALRKGDPELWSQAMNVIDQDWAAADKLIARHKANPFIPTDVETMVLLHRRVDLKNEFNKAHQELLLSEKEGRLEAAEAAKAVRDSMGDKLLELEEVMGKGDRAMGTMAGRAFRARQLVMNEDFSMADLMSLRESDLGRKLSRDEIAELQKISDENARLNNEFAALLEAHEKNQAAADMRKAVADSEARTKQTMPYHPRILELAEGYAKKWDERGSQALTDLKAMFSEGQAFSGAPISPAMLDKAIIYGTSKMVRGAVDLAKWTDAMVRDLGPGFSKYAKEIFDASKKAFDADVATAFKKQGTATVQRVKGALKGADLGTETILKKIQRKVEESKGLLPDLKYHLDKLLDFYVRKGLKEEGPLLDAIHADVKKVIPDITRRETREILAGYGSFKPLSKDAISVIKRDMHGQWQEISKIDMIQRGIFPPKLQERATMSDKQRWLRKQYEEQKRLHPEVTPLDPESQLKTALQSAKTRITNQITDLEHQIQTRTKIVRETKKLKPDAELDRLTAIRDEMRAVYDTVFKKPELTDAERLEIWKERTRDRIAELTEKVRNKDFQPRKKPEPLKYDKEAQRIRFELHKVHRALLDLRYNDRMSKRNATQKAFDAVANAVWFQRAMMTTGEFSGVLRQGGALAYQNPTIAVKNLKPMMEAFKSEKAQFEIMEEILTRDNAPLYEKYGLEFTEAGTRLSSMEEHFMFRLSENMQKKPGLKQLVGTVNKFQRAYTVFLNKMRADVFDVMADTWGKDPVTLEQIANAINVFSGRGSKGVGKFLGSGQLANTIAFAPKYAISRIQILAGQPAWRGNAHTRKMIAWQYLKMLRGPAALYALGTLMGGKVGTDSNSSDFGKLIIGNTRIDPWMGILQPAVLFSRLGTGKKTTAAGRSVPIRGKVPYGGDNAWDLISDFGRGKLSPSVGSMVSVLSGEDPIGQPFGITDALKTTFYPMTYRDIIKLYGEHGIPEATAMATLGVLGVGINTYDKRKKTQQTPW